MYFGYVHGMVFDFSPVTMSPYFFGIQREKFLIKCCPLGFVVTGEWSALTLMEEPLLNCVFFLFNVFWQFCFFQLPVLNFLGVPATPGQGEENARASHPARAAPPAALLWKTAFTHFRHVHERMEMSGDRKPHVLGAALGAVRGGLELTGARLRQPPVTC